MFLSSTSDVLRLITGSAGNIDVLASWADKNGTTITVSKTATNITTATTTTIVSAPGSGVQRSIVTLSVKNKDSSSQVVKIALYDGTNEFEIVSATLEAGESLHYRNEAWVTLTVSGNVKTQNITDSGVSEVPGGADTNIQFNESGAFGGEAALSWDYTTNTLVLEGTDTGINLKGITNEPSAPSGDNLHFYSKKIAGKMIPKIVGPTGLDTPMQVAFWQNNIIMWNPTTATAGVWLGSAGAGAGTYSTASPTTTSFYTAMKRGRWANVATTANQVLGQRNTESLFFFGSMPGMGGFFFYARCGFDVWTNGGRFYAGLHSATTVVSAEPSALANVAGFCCESSDSGAISILTRGSSLATKTSTGFTITSGKGYDLFLFAAPNSTVLNWRIVELNTGAEASGTVSTTMPAVNTMLTVGVLASNAALTTATAIQLGVNRIYVETDR